MTVYYLGQFPPPYGGVTVKNALLCEELSKHVAIEVLSFRETSLVHILRKVLLSRAEDVFVVGFGNKDLRRRFVKVLGTVRPAVLGRMLLIGMGGRLGHELEEDAFYARCCARMRAVCLETEGMVAAAHRAAVRNAVVLRNCRPRPESCSCAVSRERSEPLRAVFLSRVSTEKGADIVLETARLVPGVEFDIYGPVDDAYAESFKTQMESLSNVRYCGVFDNATGDIICELAQYDVHLFPSRWPYEGVPGVLVETKMAAVPSIVSDACYNAEIVVDVLSGILVSEDCTEAWARELRALDDDRPKLDRLKRGAYESAEEYYTDACIGVLLEVLNGGSVS